MNIHIIAVGKIRETYIREGINEFLKRITPYSPIRIIEIDAETVKKNCEQKCVEAEGEKILSQISEHAFVIAMEVTGKSLSSEKFASLIKDINNSGANQAVFVIGGSHGLSDAVRKRADVQISLSAMTFPHQLIRLFLVEQIYRAFKIANNEPYHK